MASLWPWLAIAVAGALHGLNPVGGWMFAAASGVRSRDRAKALRALVPIAAGHAASTALVAAALAFGLVMDRGALQALAAALLAVAVILHHRSDRRARARASAGQAGLALWSFMMSTAQGAGLMMVPALMPVCLGATSAGQVTASSSATLALAAVAVHTLAMLAVGGVLSISVCRGAELCRGAAARRAPEASASSRALA